LSDLLAEGSVLREQGRDDRGGGVDFVLELGDAAMSLG
jgi:hypothetical protein